MANTPRLGLPLVQAAQAQKHVTVNEAFVLLDGIAQLTLQSTVVTLPPTLAVDGACYSVPVAAVNEWATHIGEIAIRSNGGWVYSLPQKGWKAWVADGGYSSIFDGGSWLQGAVAMSPNNAATIQEVIEVDHVIIAGTTSTIIAAIPAHSVVIGVTGRVLSAITGTLATWRLGVPSADNRFGSGLGLASGSWVRGITGSPQTYYADTDLLLSGEGGDFAQGTIRLAVHLIRLTLPNS